jgi:hypothetical protein
MLGLFYIQERIKPMVTAKNKSKKSTDKTGSSKRTNQRPGKAPHGPEDERYPLEAESADQIKGADPTFTERNDVTPPNKKEFPSVGAAKTDFESRPHGRTTGRMIGHEPGTEGI